MSLVKILDDINENKKIAETDLDTVSRRALPYKKGQVDSAKHKLEGLYVDYKNELLNRSVFILTTGKDAELFAEIAEREFKCFRTDGKKLFKEIVDEISPDLYIGKKVNASVFDVVGNVLEEKLKVLDIIAYNTLMFEAKYERVCSSKVEFTNLITQAIGNIVGLEIVGLDALERIAQDAVNKSYSSKMVPILIHSKDEEFINRMSNPLRTLSPRVVRIAAGETAHENLNPLVSLTEINEETVGKALKEIAANA